MTMKMMHDMKFTISMLCNVNIPVSSRKLLSLLIRHSITRSDLLFVCDMCMECCTGALKLSSLISVYDQCR